MGPGLAGVISPVQGGRSRAPPARCTQMCKRGRGVASTDPSLKVPGLGPAATSRSRQKARPSPGLPAQVMRMHACVRACIHALQRQFMFIEPLREPSPAPVRPLTVFLGEAIWGGWWGEDAGGYGSISKGILPGRRCQAWLLSGTSSRSHLLLELGLGRRPARAGRGAAGHQGTGGLRLGHDHRAPAPPRLCQQAADKDPNPRMFRHDSAT